MAHVITPITRLLIANRGEIARRIIRTAHDMGISTVAIYADGDAQAPFVKEADSAVALTVVPPQKPILTLIKCWLLANAGCRCNPSWLWLFVRECGIAQAVIDAGIKWLGPTPEVIGRWVTNSQQNVLWTKPACRPCQA
ncbi:MAG: hypothetical protein CM15mP120_24290 [Pseudomonadota bacterium]|nr:MAG: hypothetical protein CM15mP120_24290 [Pseudomonadota bacterium]